MRGKRCAFACCRHLKLEANALADRLAAATGTKTSKGHSVDIISVFDKFWIHFWLAGASQKCSMQTASADRRSMCLVLIVLVPQARTLRHASQQALHRKSSRSQRRTVCENDDHFGTIGSLPGQFKKIPLNFVSLS